MFVNKNKTLLYLIPPALILVTIIKGITSYAKDYFIGYVGQKVINNIRDELYAHVQSLSFSYFTRTPTGVIVSRIMNDVNLVQGALTRVPATVVQGIATMIGLLVVIFYLNWRLAAAFICSPASCGPGPVQVQQTAEKNECHYAGTDGAVDHASA